MVSFFFLTDYIKFTPVKKETSGTDYFNFVVQTEMSAKRAVCFSPTRRNRIIDLQVSKSPVKISNARQSQSPDIMINYNTRIKAAKDVPFVHDPKMGGSAFVKLIDIQKVATGQLINVIAGVHEISSITTFSTTSGEGLEK